MKTVKSIYVLLVTCMVFILAGCDKDDEKVPVNPTLNPSIVSVKKGAAATVNITGGEAPYTVTSSATNIASVSVNGNTITITGVTAGNATITVIAKDSGTANVSVKVEEEDAPPPPPEEKNPNDDGTGETFLFGPDYTQIGSGERIYELTKSHTIKKGVYTLVGWIYVKEGATLTIEPGTVIKGSNKSYDGSEAATGSSIIIERGAKIMADGTVNAPIVFTSAQPKGQRKAADWGGIIICGRAINNQGEMTIEGGVNARHGGNDNNDNSGVIRYCRIEFGGYPFSTDNEINGLTLGSVGSGTTLEYIQVSCAGDDSFEWFGGNVNAKHLIAYHGWDDDFDTDNGFSGKLQFLLSVRHTRIADTSNSNSFESDNNADGSTNEPYTTCVFSNVTIVGPLGQDENFVNDNSYIDGLSWGEDAGIKTGIFQSAMQIRRNSRLSCFNSVAMGYPVGLILENDKGSTTTTWADNGNLKLMNIIFAGMNITGADANQKTDGTWTGDVSADYFTKEGLNNAVLNNIADLKLKQPNSLLSSPNWGPIAGSPLLGVANFDDALLQGFDKVTYTGAFASDTDADNWTKSWANFDPQNTDY